MLIRCEKCSTLYELDEKLLPAQGAPVQCSKCQFVFKAYPAPPRQANTPDRAANDTPGDEAAPEPVGIEPERPRPSGSDVVREGGMLAHSFDRARARPPGEASGPGAPEEEAADPGSVVGPSSRMPSAHDATRSDEQKFTADGRPIRKVPFPAGDSAQQGPRTPPFRAPAPKPTARTRTLPKPWILAAVAVVIVLALIAAWLAFGRAPSRPAATTGAGAPAGQSRAAPQGGTPAAPARN